MTLSYSLSYLETIWVHPTRRQKFANTVQPHWTQDLTPRHREQTHFKKGLPYVDISKMHVCTSAWHRICQIRMASSNINTRKLNFPLFRSGFHHWSPSMKNSLNFLLLFNLEHISILINCDCDEHCPAFCILEDAEWKCYEVSQTGLLSVCWATPIAVVLLQRYEHLCNSGDRTFWDCYS